MTSTKSQAIQTALNGDWKKAIILNKQILIQSPNDVDAMNRLAFALASLGYHVKAKSMYKKVLEIDEQNAIAQKHLKRLSSILSKTNYAASSVQMNNVFIEEPGKTKIVDLINVTDYKTTNRLHCGETLTLQIKRMKIFILDKEKRYIGVLPDDLSKRLIRFINAGNCYEAYVKTVNARRFSVFIKETKRVQRFKNQPSFPTNEKAQLLTSNPHSKQIA